VNPPEPAKVGDVIWSGEAIPDNVVEVVAADDDHWRRKADGTWGIRLNDGSLSGSVRTDELVNWRPYTVTAVREPEPDEPSQRARDSHAAMIAQGCCGMVAVHFADCPQFDRAALEATLHEYAEPAAEPQQPDASGVLDLVRQYGDVRFETGTLLDGGARDAFVASRMLAESLFARIAALIPQQPVQAHNGFGAPWWIHTCGGTRASRSLPGDRHCDNPGPWRPLFVGGDPAPEQPKATHDDFKQLAGIKGNSPRHLLAQVMAELGVDRPEDVLGALAIIRTNRDQWLAQAKHYRKQRNEARRENQEVRELLAVAELGVPSTRPPAEPGPLRLTLPEVPRKGVTLVGSQGTRFVPVGGASWQAEVEGGRCFGLGELLDLAAPLTVEAPPRKPRTWPKLDDAPPDLRAVRGASGRVYRPHDDGRDARWYYVDAAHGKLGFESFAEIAYQDGPLTEVLDEPGATS
jgi:hypothetical protein